VFMTGTLFRVAAERRYVMDRTAVLSALAECYRHQGVAADQLPYTEEFDQLHEEVQRRTGLALTRAEFWRLLANARKRGVLPRLAR
jgi:hypothetical protein